MVAVLNDSRPAYRVLATSGFFGPDDHLYAEGQIIYYPGEPNLEFEPLTPPAREAMKAYIDKLDAEGRKVAEKNGRAYLGIAKTLDDAVSIATADRRRVELVAGDGGRPVMGARKQGGQVEAVAEEQVPEDGRRPQGRPGKLSAA